MILCTEVLNEGHGPTSEIKKYHVWIVAGGHKQVEGINFETFSVAVKMLQRKTGKFIKLM